MGKMNLVIIGAVLGLSSFAMAQTESEQQSNQSTVKQSEVKPANSDLKDTDEEITNKKLRAQLGSKSKWSIRTAMAYQGGSIEKPLDEKRPNYRSSTGTRSDVYSYMNVAAKYRMTDRTSLNLGTGITVMKPFHRTSNEATSKSENFNISNPYLEGNFAYKVGDLQMVSSASVTGYTESFDVDVRKGTGSLGVDQTVILDSGRLSGGISVAISREGYADSKETFFNPYSNKVEDKTEYSLGIYPFAEYGFTDKLSFRTVFGYFNYEKTLAASSFSEATPYQSMGIGISVTRDFYLYPNVQFVPNDVRAERTNVGLSANINLL
ncbi:MAG: hypothetical protein AABY64_00725 [Bdellovibrionota bacterium]